MAAARALAINTTLHTLKIADNEINEAAAWMIADALEENNTLHTLELLGNNVTKKVEDKLERIMRDTKAYVRVRAVLLCPSSLRASAAAPSPHRSQDLGTTTAQQAGDGAGARESDRECGTGAGGVPGGALVGDD